MKVMSSCASIGNRFKVSPNRIQYVENLVINKLFDAILVLFSPLLLSLSLFFNLFSGFTVIKRPMDKPNANSVPITWLRREKKRKMLRTITIEIIKRSNTCMVRIHVANDDDDEQSWYTQHLLTEQSKQQKQQHQQQ